MIFQDLETNDAEEDVKVVIAKAANGEYVKLVVECPPDAEVREFS
jgi:hypothetical protein